MTDEEKKEINRWLDIIRQEVNFTPEVITALAQLDYLLACP
jgi:hypothetical protein